MTDVYSKRKRSEIMSRVRNTKTGPEESVAKILRGLGIRYRRNVKGLPGTPDFVVRSRQTVIFMHGCFWHGHSNCGRAKLPTSHPMFWVRKVQTNKKRDARKSRELRRMGWHVWTVWQCHLRKPEQVQRRLSKLI